MVVLTLLCAHLVAAFTFQPLSQEEQLRVAVSASGSLSAARPSALVEEPPAELVARHARLQHGKSASLAEHSVSLAALAKSKERAVRAQLKRRARQGADPSEIPVCTCTGEDESTDEGQCCNPPPSEAGECSWTIPQSLIAKVNSSIVTNAWAARSDLFCNVNGGVIGEGERCDPCRPLKAVEDVSWNDDLYCSQADKGELHCYGKTSTAMQLTCEPQQAQDGSSNDQYGGWKLNAADVGWPYCKKR